ncbi:hypothetical protein LOZ53_004335 [Ophidiomyces ophidiicola]|nr:hypothetical protein LOZ55_002450 [Ophidiomyces ophidiicola]KAI1987466.1 hypothetical protein LOZ53_004335 [Ophidiomyces ophidiicola]KAI1988079.1 hypothetical protein LOZ51_005560 [Ophidiomyces ophidiicola]KAI1988349.1 hypothetical protein LOZ54_003244 [Ophidiomyces ophidiicola]
MHLAYAERGISRVQDRRYEEGEADLEEALRIRKALGNYIPRSRQTWAGRFLRRRKALGKDDKESARTGLILYVLGNVQATQQLWDASFEYHQRALRHMIATVGEKDFYTANVIHKVAEHLIRLDENDEALAMVNKTLDIWCVDRNVHKIEIARTTFLKGKLFETMGKIQNR